MKKAILISDLPEPSCANCTLNESTLPQHPKMLPTGSETPSIYILGETPGQADDEQGVQFVGRAGQFLRRFIPPDTLQDIRWNNMLRCHTPGNRAPQILELHCCGALQAQDIERTKPKMIWGFGRTPLTWACGETKINAWRGRKLPVRFGEHICWYYPMLHPDSFLWMGHKHTTKEMYADTVRVFDYDIQRALWDLQHLPDAKAFYEDDSLYYNGIECCITPEDADRLLAKAMKWDYITVDIETSGLRPFVPGARIITIALSNFDGSETVAFPFTLKAAKLFEDYKRRFNAQNSKYEMLWLSYFLGDDILHCHWDDTEAQAYILDERQGVLNLNALTKIYMGFGVKSLSDIDVEHMEEEWKRDPENVLKYNALDAKYTAKLHRFLNQDLDVNEQQGIYQFLVSTLPGIVLMERQGLVVNWQEAFKQHEHCCAERLKIENEIFKNEHVQKFMAANGKTSLGKAEDQFNIGSWQQIMAFFADQGIFLESTDEDHLSRENHPVAKLILKWREYGKLLSTYIEPIVTREVVMADDRIHTSMNPYVTGTGRLSSTEPNIQNFPKREHQEIRNIITVPPGYTGVSGDYGQIEARIIACAANDPYFIKALHDGMDIHMTEAKNLVEAHPALLNRYRGNWKALRDDVKNLWVFPAFYGACLDAIASYLNIKSSILEAPFNDFWHRYRATKAWQIKVLRDFKANGYVPTLTGRHRHGPLKTNEIINSPIQGTAHDIVFKSMITLTNLALELDMLYLAPVIELHDDLTFYLPNDKINDIVPLIAEIMCTPGFDWLTVPLTVEMSTWTLWGTKKEFATYDSRTFTTK